jgi:class 3 adenylate cyclase
MIGVMDELDDAIDLAAPSGVVTFLFTDVEGSTRRWENDANAMQAALAAHDEVLRGAIEAHGGFMFKHTGDGVCAAFSSPGGAVDAAVAAQRALQLPVRMGITTGEAELRGTDYFGAVLNRAARVMAVGHGGQILLAESTAVLLSAVDLLDLGPRLLRDLSTPVGLFQVRAPGIRTDFPPLRAPDASLAQLPDEFPDGVSFRELAAVADPAAVPDAVAPVGRPRLRLITMDTRPNGLPRPATAESPRGALSPTRAGRCGVRPQPQTSLLHGYNPTVGEQPSTATDTFAKRLSASRARLFAGRVAEVALFESALRGGGAVLWVCGAGGIGKSTLLDRFGERARRANRPVVQVDCRTIAPTPRAFTEAAIGTTDVAGSVLLVDTFEQAGDLEDWFRSEFLPSLPTDCLVVVASRADPAPAWRVDAGWHDALRVLSLTDLPRADAVTLLSLRGAPATLHDQVLDFAGGHPLALVLAATVAGMDGSSSRYWRPGEDVLRTLMSTMVGLVPSPTHRRALEVCAHAYDTTEDLLRAVVTEDAGELFAWLRRQPYIESGPNGLFPHDVLRDVLDADLRWRDPEGYEAMHRGIRGYLLDQARRTDRVVGLHVMGALAFLHRHGGVMADFVSSRRTVEVEEYDLRPEDRQALLRIATAAEGVESARLVEFWLDRQPDAFHVYRSTGTGEPVAFMAWLRLATPSDDELSADPVLDLAWQHTRAAAPLRAGEHIAMARFMVDPVNYQRPSAVADLFQQRILFEWLRACGLAWSYLVMADPLYWRSQMDYLGQHLVDGEAVAGDRSYSLFAHDWRAVSADQWMDRHVEQELFGPRPPPDTPARHLVVLSREEFGQSVRQGLRDWHRDDLLASNPLTYSRVVAERDSSDPVSNLRGALTVGLDSLARDPRTEAAYRAVATTYIRGAPTQEAAAERLGLPMSTFRRHLSRGVDTICDVLWQQELHGVNTA